MAFLTGGLLNIFVPSGGGEWAVVGQPIVEAAKTVAANTGMTAEATQAFIAKVSMSVGYGDSWTNMIQPFWTLAFFPIVAAGSSLQARDIMGYTFVAMLWSLIIFGLGVTFLPDEKGRFEAKVRELTAPLNPTLFEPLNVQEPAQIEAVSSLVVEDFLCRQIDLCEPRVAVGKARGCGPAGKQESKDQQELMGS